jgi:hypothetical protein
MGVMEKRIVEYCEYEIPPDGIKYERTSKGDAIFHEFGVDYEEFETGPGNFSTAIIELPDGSVKNIPVDQIKFKEIEK